jgi:two-component system, NarL family, response regulator NreC
MIPPSATSARESTAGMAAPQSASRGPGASVNGAHAGVQAPAIRVALADDRALIRRGLRMLLGTQEGIEVMPGGGDVSSLALVTANHPDVLVLDIGLPGRLAITAIARLRERAPETQIVVLAAQPEPTFAQRAAAAGALGFVAKESAERDLPRAVRAAAGGEYFVSSSVAGGLESTRRSFAQDHLTAREIEVLRLIALGHTSAEVARTLALSPRTVETHRARIHKKLGLATRAELVSYALRRRLLRA